MSSTFDKRSVEINQAELVGHVGPGEVSVTAEEALADEETAAIEDVIQAFFALGMLDRDAAAAYALAAEYVDDMPKLRDTLLGFANDHLRHLRDINQLLGRYGSQTVPEQGGTTSTLALLTDAICTADPSAVIAALLTNAELTHSTYDLLTEIVDDGDARALIERSLTDERRHLVWLGQHLEDVETGS